MARSVYYKHVVGAEALSFALRTISDEMRSIVLEKAARAACEPVLVAAKRFAKRSERTGALRASLTIKTVAYPHSGKAVALVGPDRAYYWKGLVITRLNASLRKADRPAHYAHLVEFGHNVVAPIKNTSLRKKTAIPAKTGTRWVPAKPFIRPALLTTTAQQASAFTKAIESGLNRSIAKANRAALK